MKQNLFIVLVILFSLMSLSPSEANWISFNPATARRERDYQAAVSLLEQEDYDLARVQFNNCLDNYSDTEYRARVFYGLAEIDYVEDKYEAALENYLQALEKEKLDRERTNYALERALEAALISGRIDSGQKVIAHLQSQEQPFEFVSEPVVKTALEFFKQTGQSEKALGWAENFHKENPQNHGWTYRLARLKLQNEAYQESFALLESISFDTSPYRQEAVFLSAEIYYQIDEMEAAQRNYYKLLESEAFKTRALYGLAWVEIEKSNLEEAVEKLERTYADTDIELRFLSARDLARVNRTLGETEAAVSWYQKAVRLAAAEQDSRLRLEFGDYLVELDRFEDAVSHYEKAQNLGPEATRRLINWYLSRDEYEAALTWLRELEESGDFDRALDKYRIALALYHLGDSREARQYLPESSDEVELQEKIWRLAGRIHFDRKDWDRAREVYAEWFERTRADEALYSRALVEDQAGRSRLAVEYWNSLIEEKPSEPWRSRTFLQLARSVYGNGDIEKYNELVGRVVSEYLNQALVGERALIELEIALDNETMDENLLKKIEATRVKASKAQLEAKWLRLLLGVDLPRDWWKNEFLPIIFENNELLNSAGYLTPDHVHTRGWPQWALEIGDELLAREISDYARQKLLITQMKILHSENRTEKIGDYLPAPEQWREWSAQTAYELALNLTRYHRFNDNYRAGLDGLKELKNTIDFSVAQQRMVDEWIASLEINLQDYSSAYERLERIGWEDLTSSGRLNFIVTLYFGGEAEESKGRFERLKADWENPPVEFYEAGFRIYRKVKNDTGLFDLSAELTDRADIVDTEILELEIENVKYWNAEEKYQQGLQLIEKLRLLKVGAELKNQVRYYRAVLEFNSGDLETALVSLQDIYETDSFDTDSFYRSAGLEVEIQLRLGNWPAAYERWQQIDELGRGGEPGLRLLSGLGIEQAPENFKLFVVKMKKDYPRHLSETEHDYWQARLEEIEKNPRAALRRYEAYLASGDPRRAESVRGRMAEIYDSLGEHDQAIEQYRLLLENTADPLYRVFMAVQLGKNERFAEAEQQLEVSLQELPEREGWIRYQLGIIHQAQQDRAAAFEAYSSALNTAVDTPGWAEEARRSAVEIGLSLNRLDQVQHLVDAMTDSSVKQLFEIELLRRRGQQQAALDRLNEYRNKYPDRLETEEFLKVAPAVYWAAGHYDTFLQVSPEPPQDPGEQVRVMRALLELDRSSEAERLYHRLDSEAVEVGARLLGDYHYKNENWRPALVYYREARPAVVITFRLGRIHYQLEYFEQSYQTLLEFFASLEEDGDTELIKAALSIFEEVVVELEKYDSAGRVLIENWAKIAVQEQAARLGFRWANQSADIEQLDFFSTRLLEYSPQEFETAAARIEELEAWSVLETLLEKVDSQQTPDFSHEYFNLLAELHLQSGKDYVDRVNDQIDNAAGSGSVYGPRLQRLLGDYYLKRGEYEQAAIEYHKILLLFEENDQQGRARLGMARGYERAGLERRSRRLYEELVEGDYPGHIRSEAARWLEENS